MCRSVTIRHAYDIAIRKLYNILKAVFELLGTNIVSKFFQLYLSTQVLRNDYQNIFFIVYTASLKNAVNKVKSFKS